MVALPRSGTTVVTAMLSVHSSVEAIYEPWNSNKNTVDAADAMAFDAFLARFVPTARRKPTLVVKETATRLLYLDRVEQLFQTVPPGVDPALVVILRNPFHVYLSEVVARRRWWGVEDLEIGPASFSDWLARSRAAYRQLERMAQEYNALILSYEEFAESRDVIDLLTRSLGLVPEEAQHNYHKHLDRNLVRGDRTVAEEPYEISARSVRSRTSELEQVRPLIESVEGFAACGRLAREIAGLPAVSRARAQPGLLRMLRDL